MTGARSTRVAIVGGGLSGLATAWQLQQEAIDFALYEASPRLGGIVETVCRDGFVIECGPDSWVSEKPWARDLVKELGLEDQLVPSNDQWRRTYIQQGTDRPELVPIPDGMRMMVPLQWGPMLESPLFSWQARLAYLREPKRAEELKSTTPAHDESVESFIHRHFGGEVARQLAGPLLSAVFGGNIAELSVRAVMPGFVRLESEYGSLIAGLQKTQKVGSASIFTSMAGGLQTLVDRIVRDLSAASIRLRQPVQRIGFENNQWHVKAGESAEAFSAVVLATPLHTTRTLLRLACSEGSELSSLLPTQASSAILVALAFAPKQAVRMRIPRGFGFVVPTSESRVTSDPALLACTFVDQKFPGRAPQGATLLRAFFGGRSAAALLQETDDQLLQRARRQLERALGTIADPMNVIVRRWPESLPQYGVGHLDRMAQLEAKLQGVPGLHLVGSAYHGVGLPDLIRQGRQVARNIKAGSAPAA